MMYVVYLFVWVKEGKGKKEGEARVFIGTARDCSGDERRR